MWCKVISRILSGTWRTMTQCRKLSILNRQFVRKEAFKMFFFNAVFLFAFLSNSPKIAGFFFFFPRRIYLFWTRTLFRISNLKATRKVRYLKYKYGKHGLDVRLRVLNFVTQLLHYCSHIQNLHLFIEQITTNYILNRDCICSY